MSFDQKVQLWIAIGAWFTGFATFAAVFVSLYLVRRQDKSRLKCHVGLREMVSGYGSAPQSIISFEVTNIGDRPVVVNSVGWKVGQRKAERFAIAPLSTASPHQCPMMLAHGETGQFWTFLSYHPKWKDDFISGFVRNNERKTLESLRGLVNTSLGESIEIVPEDDFINWLAT